MKSYFITGIGTGVGKTVISAILTLKLKADYWKPIQAGDLHDTDSMKIKKWIGDSNSTIHPETFKLTLAMSPHAAALQDGLNIALSDFVIPDLTKPLIIEGAGGLLVPLNNKETMIDLIQFLDGEVILVSDHYLGSINHTLLSVDALQNRNIPIAGIVFNGDNNQQTESIIQSMSGLEILGRIPKNKSINIKLIKQYIDLINI